MRCAERFPTKELLHEALVKYGSWYRICRQGFAETSDRAKAEKPKPKKKATYGGRRLRQLHAEKRAGGKQTNVWELQIAVSQANQLLERFELVELEWDEHGDIAERLQWIYDDVAMMVSFGEAALNVITAHMDDLGRQRKLQALAIRAQDASSTSAEREAAARLHARLQNRRNAKRLGGTL
jgi:hypothetical protein